MVTLPARLLFRELKQMTDIHSHIIPRIDDGSRNIVESLEMLAAAFESGVDAIVATPHCNIPDVCGNYENEDIEISFEILSAAANRAGIPIKIYRGAEIYATEYLPELLEDGRVRTINGGKYFLTEFPFDELPDYAFDVLYRCLELGFVPIIAHPERYEFVLYDWQIAYEFVKMGCLLQVNKSSFFGDFGQEQRLCAEQLAHHNLIAAVASDAHSADVRTTEMGRTREYLIRKYGTEFSKKLLELSPSRIVNGADLDLPEPIPFEPVKNT